MSHSNPYAKRRASGEATEGPQSRPVMEVSASVYAGMPAQIGSILTVPVSSRCHFPSIDRLAAAMSTTRRPSLGDSKSIGSWRDRGGRSAVWRVAAYGTPLSWS